MKITHNDIEYTFSVRSHPGKFSQSKQKEVGKCKDLDVAYNGQTASVTMGLKPGRDGDVPETAADTVSRLAERIGLELRPSQIKEIAGLL